MVKGHRLTKIGMDVDKLISDIVLRRTATVSEYGVAELSSFVIVSDIMTKLGIPICIDI